MYWNSGKKYQKKVEGWVDSPAYKKNLQTMQVLITLPRFQELVRQTRKACKIPLKGYKSSKYSKKHTGAYFLCSLKEPWQWPNKINSVFDYYLTTIFFEFGLPEHFEKAITQYIYFNYVSAPIFDFLIDPATKRIQTIPQKKEFTSKLSQAQLDIQEEAMETLINSPMRKKPLSPLLTKQIAYKKGLKDNLIYQKKVAKHRKILSNSIPPTKNEKESYKKIKDKLIANSIEEDNDNLINSVTKKIRNNRQYMRNILKERGFKKD